MPRSNHDQVPCAYVVAGTWPQAQLTEDAPVSAFYGQEVAVNLTRAMQAKGVGLRQLGEESGVSHTTISRVLRGQVLPDLGTLARLAAGDLRAEPRLPIATSLAEQHGGAARWVRATLQISTTP
ncbi:helix-turn-helix domain-containing protein [Streptomyces sp. NBC_00470]|uniref:helix-turn-helix domain-containing protein n=1 Tax=Streptomyces sp. NBC_00470 TaxID=2975753 RepID=UPI0030DEDD97